MLYVSWKDVPNLKSYNLRRRAIDPAKLYDKLVSGDVDVESGQESEYEGVGPSGVKPRKLGKVAASTLVRLLSSARMARFDILRIACGYKGVQLDGG